MGKKRCVSAGGRQRASHRNYQSFPFIDKEDKRDFLYGTQRRLGCAERSEVPVLAGWARKRKQVCSRCLGQRRWGGKKLGTDIDKKKGSGVVTSKEEGVTGVSGGKKIQDGGSSDEGVLVRGKTCFLARAEGAFKFPGVRNFKIEGTRGGRGASNLGANRLDRGSQSLATVQRSGAGRGKETEYKDGGVEGGQGKVIRGSRRQDRQRRWKGRRSEAG